MGRRKACGRAYMFSVRLSVSEQDDLDRLLRLSEGDAGCKSDLFRDIVHELQGILSRPLVHLVLEYPHQRRAKLEDKRQQEDLRSVPDVNTIASRMRER